MTLSAAQCRMARTGLRIGTRTLAEQAKVSTNTLSRFEGGDSVHLRTQEAIRSALEFFGATFLDEKHGVRLSWYPVDRNAVEKANWGEWRNAATESAAVANIKKEWREVTGGQGGAANIWFALDVAQTFRVAEVETGADGSGGARYRVKPRILLDSPESVG